MSLISQHLVFIENINMTFITLKYMISISCPKIIIWFWCKLLRKTSGSHSMCVLWSLKLSHSTYVIFKLNTIFKLCICGGYMNAES